MCFHDGFKDLPIPDLLSFKVLEIRNTHSGKTHEAEKIPGSGSFIRGKLEIIKGH